MLNVIDHKERDNNNRIYSLFVRLEIGSFTLEQISCVDGQFKLFGVERKD